MSNFPVLTTILFIERENKRIKASYLYMVIKYYYHIYVAHSIQCTSEHCIEGLWWKDTFISFYIFCFTLHSQFWLGNFKSVTLNPTFLKSSTKILLYNIKICCGDRTIALKKKYQSDYRVINECIRLKLTKLVMLLNVFW